jgi:threonine dehydratase
MWRVLTQEAGAPSVGNHANGCGLSRTVAGAPVLSWMHEDSAAVRACWASPFGARTIYNNVGPRR